MAAIKVADLFASIGMKVDVRQLNMFQKRLAGVKKQLLDLKRLSRTQLAPKTNLGGVQSLNAALTRTLALRRQINAQGGIGGLAAAAGAGGRRGGGGGKKGGKQGVGGGFFGGAAAGSLGVRGGFIQRNFLGGFTAVLAAKQLFQATATLQGIEVALGAVTREGQTTAEVMAFLRGEASRLGFDFASSALEYAKLAAAGNSVNLQQETINQTFIAAQEAARVFNLSVADTEGVLKAFTQIISKGKITAEELRNQLGDRLPGAVGIFATALGVSTQELSEMLEKGQVLADDKTLLAVAKQLRSTVAKEVENASKSLTASANRFRTALFEFSAGLGRAGASGVFQVGLAALTNILKILGPILKTLIAAVRFLLFPFQAFGRILIRITDSIPKTSSAIIGLTGIVLLLRSAMLRTAIAWVTAFAPILATGAVVAAMAIIIEDLITAVEGGDSVIGRLAASSNVFISVIAGSLINLGKFVQFIAEFVAAIATGNFDEITASFQRFVSAVADFFRNPISSKLTDLLEFLFMDDANIVDPNFGRVANFQLPSERASAGTSSEVQVTIIDGAGLVDAVQVVQDGNLRQAQGDFPNNE